MVKNPVSLNIIVFSEIVNVLAKGSHIHTHTIPKFVPWLENSEDLLTLYPENL